MEENRRKALIVIYFCIAVYVLPMYPHGGSANELTRWATAASIVEHGSFDIAWTEELIGPNVDTARIGSNLYSNKAPGVALLGVPAYAAVRPFIGPPDASNIRISWFAMKVVSATLPLLILAVWLYRKGADELGLAALFFATPLFVYSLLLFSHALAAVLIYAAFRLLFDGERTSQKNYFLAGAFCGLAVVSELPAAIAVVVFAVGVIFKRDRAGIAWFAAAGLPFLVVLLAYNAALFGSALSFSYAHESFPEWAEVAGKGIFGIGFPTLSNAYLLLLSPSRGLLFFAPILALGLASLVTSPERRSPRHLVRVAAIVASIIVLCGHGAAHGGWAFGPRYIVFVIPLLLDPMLRNEPDRMPAFLKFTLLGASVVLSIVGVLTFPFAPPEFSFPHNAFWGSLLTDERWFVPTIANVIGIAPHFSNVVPVLFGMLVVLFLVVRNVRDMAGAAAGVMLGVVMIVSPMASMSPDLELRRATIAERFFRPGERLSRFQQDAKARGDIALLRRINEFEWIVADARAYAPDDFPYVREEVLPPSPARIVREAAALQQQRKTAEAVSLLSDARSRFSDLACEFTVSIAVVSYSAGMKDAARDELLSLAPEPEASSSPECMRAEFLLGSLFRESGDNARATFHFERFLQISNGVADPQIRTLQKQLGK